MSVSKWAYEPEKCDGDFCAGDCDACPKAEERPCSKCIHRKDGGCEKWECEFEPKSN